VGPRTPYNPSKNDKNKIDTSYGPCRAQLSCISPHSLFIHPASSPPSPKKQPRSHARYAVFRPERQLRKTRPTGTLVSECACNRARTSPPSEARTNLVPRHPLARLVKDRLLVQVLTARKRQPRELLQLPCQLHALLEGDVARAVSCWCRWAVKEYVDGGRGGVKLSIAVSPEGYRCAYGVEAWGRVGWLHGATLAPPEIWNLSLSFHRPLSAPWWHGLLADKIKATRLRRQKGPPPPRKTALRIYSPHQLPARTGKVGVFLSIGQWSPPDVFRGCFAANFRPREKHDASEDLRGRAGPGRANCDDGKQPRVRNPD